jgi:energy-coupling factor transporter ATP-binding protein EcfA2
MPHAPRDVINGEGAIVLVGGQAGIGKTSFVTALAEILRPLARVFLGGVRSSPETLCDFYGTLPEMGRNESASALKLRASSTCPVSR